LTNAKKRPESDVAARALVQMIEASGLDYKAGQSVRLDDHIGKAVSRIVFSPEGKQAALEATARGLPALAGLDPLLSRALGPDYGSHNESTVQAGYLVTNMMRQLGYEISGSGSLPSGCTGKTGAVFARRV
jgi:hypothetical protein